MRAAFIRQTGGPELIEVGELPRPEPAGAQVLVRIKASAVNPVDTYVRGGLIPWELPQPFIPGCDLAGVVEALGPEAGRFAVGDRVWGSNQGLLGRQGTSAEFAAVDQRWLYPIPEGVSDDAIAASALVAITAHLGLFRDGQLREGQTVHVNGGSGGVGSMVVQMAKLAGARVITTAGSAAKARRCGELGADHVVRYRDQDLAEAVREAAPDGVDLWFETLREPDLLTSIPLLRPGGRMILMAGRDATPALPLGSFYTRDCKLLGFAMFNASDGDQRRCADQINDWMAAGRLKANIDRVLPLERLAEAHALQETSTVAAGGQLAGKIVISI